MFSFFKKPVGIYLTDQNVVLVQLKGSTVVQVHREALPPGSIVDGLMMNADAVQKTLSIVREKTQVKDVVVGLPVSKCYSGVLALPDSMSDAEMGNVFRKKAAGIVPVEIDSLVYESSILRGASEGNAYFFASGVEQDMVKALRAVFNNAGFGQVYFALETMAALKALSLEMAQYPVAMLIHQSGNRTMLAAIFHGRIFDGIHAYDLLRDILVMHKSFSDQVSVFPNHVLLSGTAASIKGLTELEFGGTAPEFVATKPKIVVENGSDLLIPIGLAMLQKECGKKRSVCLLNLLK
jgi:hypothetical protein